MPWGLGRRPGLLGEAGPGGDMQVSVGPGGSQARLCCCPRPTQTPELMAAGDPGPHRGPRRSTHSGAPPSPGQNSEDAGMHHTPGRGARRAPGPRGNERLLRLPRLPTFPTAPSFTSARMRPGFPGHPSPLPGPPAAPASPAPTQPHSHLHRGPAGDAPRLSSGKARVAAGPGTWPGRRCTHSCSETCSPPPVRTRVFTGSQLLPRPLMRPRAAPTSQLDAA